MRDASGTTPTEERRSTSSTESFHKWYAANGEEYNRTRAERYKNDPAYREAVLAKQRDRRRATSGRRKESHEQHRKIDGEDVIVYRIGHVVSVINRSEKTLRIWESKGLIPRATVPGGHRYYTQHQLNLLLAFSKAMSELRYAKAMREAQEQALSAALHANWN